MAQLKMYWLPGTPVEHFDLPEGYSVSAFNGTDADKLAWLDCCMNGLAKPEDTIEKFDRSIGPAKEKDVRFLDYQGQHVGTITPIYHPEERVGEVHMVAIHRDWRGKGLGKYLNMIALEKLKDEDLRYIYLTTDEWRAAAVKSYLRSGFLPVEYDTGMPWRWAKLICELGMPSVTMVDNEGQKPRTIAAAKKLVKIGVFGAGRGKALMKYCRETPGVELTAVCDAYEPLLEDIRNSDPEGKIKLFTSFDEFIQEDLDGVVLANYANEHAPFAIRCLNKGINVISEVLPVQTMKQAVELVEAVEKSGKVYSYAENYCYMGSTREMRKIFRSGEMGRFEYGEGEYVHNCEPGWHRYTKGDPNHWRNTMHAHYYCTHSIGPIMHIAGLRPVKVTGFEIPFNDRMYRMGAKAGPMGIEMIELENGGIIRSMHGVGPAKDSYWFCVYGDKGRLESARFDSQQGGVDTLYVNIEGRDGVETIHAGEHAGYGHSGADYYPMHYFVEKLRGNDEAEIIDVYEALDMFLPGMFAYRSALAGGIPMEIPNLRDPAQRDRWRNDTACTDPALAGDQLIPSYSKGNPDIPQAVYDEVKAEFERNPRGEKGEMKGW